MKMKNLMWYARLWFGASWLVLMGCIAYLDWGSEGLWATVIWDRSGVTHELMFMAAFGLGVLWLSTKIEEWFK